MISEPSPLPFEVAVAAQPLIDAGLSARWVTPEEWPYSWMRGRGFVLATPSDGTLTPAQRRAARESGAHAIKLAGTTYVVLEVARALILGFDRAMGDADPAALGLSTIYFGGGVSSASEDKDFHDAFHASHMRARDRWWKTHGHFGDYKLWLAMVDDATIRRFALWWFLLQERWNQSRA